MSNINKIEEEIVQAATAKKSWGEVALLTQQVERGQLWRHQDNTRSFTVWMNSLGARFSVSKSWIWMAYGAGIHLQEIWPGSENLKKILEIKPEISAQALSNLKYLRTAALKPSYVEAIEAEFLSDTMSVSMIVSLCKEVRRAIELKITPVELFATLHRIDYAEIVHG